MSSIQKQTDHILIVMAILILGTTGCTDKTADISSLIGQLKCESMMDRQAAFIELHALGKKAIPHLVDAIHDDSITFLCLHNPISSRITKGSLNNFAGILAAYMIELILAKDKLQLGGYGDSLWVFGDDPQNYIYDNGVIARNDGGDLTHVNIKKVMEIYKTWWQQNEARSIEGLRDEWKNNVRPLTGSDFHWE
jgi:hypothetical protein